MRILIILGILFISVSCSQSDGLNRGYVISKSQLEPEKEVSSQEEVDLH